MSTFKPYSSYTATALVGDYPALKMYFHWDDVIPNTTTWTCRKSGVVATAAAAIQKDSAGVYCSNQTLSSVSGTMPTCANYVVVVAIGVSQTSSPSGGIGCKLGAVAGYGFSGTGLAYGSSGTVRNTTPTQSGTLSTNNSWGCVMSYFDCVDTTSPLLSAMVANASDTGATGLAYGEGTTTDTGAITTGLLSSNLIFNGLGSLTDGRRGKVIALFDFATAPSANELQIACCEMARTGELFVGWKNRV